MRLAALQAQEDDRKARWAAEDEAQAASNAEFEAGCRAHDKAMDEAVIKTMRSLCAFPWPKAVLRIMHRRMVAAIVGR